MVLNAQAFSPEACHYTLAANVLNQQVGDLHHAFKKSVGKGEPGSDMNGNSLAGVLVDPREDHEWGNPSRSK